MRGLVFFLVMAVCAFGATITSVKESEGVGHGQTRKAAVEEALLEAVGKVNGASVSYREKLAVSEGGESYEKQLEKLTNGSVDSFEILRAAKEGDEWVAVVRVKKSVVKNEPAGGANKRRTTLVLDASKTDISKRLKNYVVSEILASRRLSVLDRANLNLRELEREFFGGEESSAGGFGEGSGVKKGEILGADYAILLGATRQRDGKFEVLLKVVLLETMQLKFSATALTGGSTTALKRTAREMVRELFDGIYPLVVVSSAGDEVAFTQKLRVGERYSCFETGEALQDAYTGERGVRAERHTGDVVVKRASAKASYAQVQSGTVSEGDVCRFVKGGAKNYNLGSDGSVNLGF